MQWQGTLDFVASVCFPFYQYNCFRDLSEIPASKSTTSIQASSDSCSPFFTDGSTASSQKLPELEIEPIGTNFNEQRQSPKIRVLQNIVIVSFSSHGWFVCIREKTTHSLSKLI